MTRRELPKLDFVDANTNLREFVDSYGNNWNRLQLRRHFSPQECTALARMFLFDCDRKGPQTIRSLAKRDLITEMKGRRNFGKTTVATLHKICARYRVPTEFPFPPNKLRHCKTCMCWSWGQK